MKAAGRGERAYKKREREYRKTSAGAHPEKARVPLALSFSSLSAAAGRTPAPPSPSPVSLPFCHVFCPVSVRLGASLDLDCSDHILDRLELGEKQQQKKRFCRPSSRLVSSSFLPPLQRRLYFFTFAFERPDSFASRRRRLQEHTDRAGHQPTNSNRASAPSSVVIFFRRAEARIFF